MAKTFQGLSWAAVLACCGPRQMPVVENRFLVRLLAEVSTELSLARPRLGLSRACLGAVLGRLGAVLELSWSVLGRLEAVRAKSGSA